MMLRSAGALRAVRRCRVIEYLTRLKPTSIRWCTSVREGRMLSAGTPHGSASNSRGTRQPHTRAFSSSMSASGGTGRIPSVTGARRTACKVIRSPTSPRRAVALSTRPHRTSRHQQTRSAPVLLPRRRQRKVRLGFCRCRRARLSSTISGGAGLVEVGGGIVWLRFLAWLVKYLAHPAHSDQENEHQRKCSKNGDYL